MLRLLGRPSNIALETCGRLSARLVCTSALSMCEHKVSIDTSGLQRPQPHSHGDVLGKEPETEMAKHIKSIIRVRQRSYHEGSRTHLTFHPWLAVSRRAHQHGRVHVGKARKELLANQQICSLRLIKSQLAVLNRHRLLTTWNLAGSAHQPSSRLLHQQRCVWYPRRLHHLA